MAPGAGTRVLILHECDSKGSQGPFLATRPGQSAQQLMSIDEQSQLTSSRGPAFCRVPPISTRPGVRLWVLMALTSVVMVMVMSM